MKNLLLSLAAIVLFTMSMSAQKQFTGIIKSKMDVEGENIDAAMKAVFPMEIEMKVLNNKGRTDMNQGGIGITTIVDGDNNKMYQIYDLTIGGMGIYYMEMPTKNDKQKIDYQYDKNDKKTILGYECYKATCIVTNLETDETQEIVMYISDDFLPDFKQMEYGEFKGFPLYTKMKMPGDDHDFFLTTEVIEIKADKKIKPVNFLLPAGAKSFDEAPAKLKAMFGMGEEEDD